MVPSHRDQTIIQEEARLELDFRTLWTDPPAHLFGVRIDEALAQSFPFFSRSKWQKRVRQGEVIVRGCRVRPSYRVKPGDDVRYFHPESREPPLKDDIRILWQEGSLAAIAKPSGIPMHENGPYRFHTVSHRVMEILGPEWAPAHRLDRETSGIVICARGLATRQDLTRQWQNEQVEKGYLAIVRGVPRRAAWSSTGAIGDDTASVIRIRKTVTDSGQPARTDFQVLEACQTHSILSCIPKTGRTNQIRVHAAHEGFPLVGDKLYHHDPSVFLDYHERGETAYCRQMTGFSRLCLHASRIRLRHPETGRMVEVTSPMPPDLVDLWASLDLQP